VRWLFNKKKAGSPWSFSVLGKPACPLQTAGAQQMKFIGFRRRVKRGPEVCRPFFGGISDRKWPKKE